jgi:hypothetical protein
MLNSPPPFFLITVRKGATFAGSVATCLSVLCKHRMDSMPDRADLSYLAHLTLSARATVSKMAPSRRSLATTLPSRPISQIDGRV